MAKDEKTGKKVAKIASKGLKTGKLTKQEILELSGSALTQAPNKKKAPKKR